MRRATSKLPALLYSIVAAIFVAGYLARYVHPRYAWWLQLIAIGLPFIAIVVAALTIPIYLSKKKSRYLQRLHTVLLVLVIVRFPPWVLLGSGRPSADDLRVLTYNAPGIALEGQQSVAQSMRALVDGTDPHFIALQEVYWRYAFGGKGMGGRSDVAKLVIESDFSDAPDSIGERIFTRQPILSRVGIRAVKMLTWEYLDSARDPFEVIRAEVEWEGRPFTLFNIHLASYGVQKPWLEAESSRYDPFVWRGYLSRYRRAILRRAWEAEVIKGVMGSEEKPILVAGDFNATPHNWTYRHIASGLTDVMTKAGTGTGFTYHRRRPIARIDFVLASKEFVPTSARVVNGHSSDHLGLLVGLRWADAR